MDKLLTLFAKVSNLKKSQNIKKTCEISFDYKLPYLENIVDDMDISEFEKIKHSLKKELKDISIPAEEIVSIEEFFSKHIFVNRFTESFLEHFENEKWLKKECPVCGNSAGVAFIGENGERKLVCNLCWTEWRFSRSVCPYCSTHSDKYAVFSYADKELRVEYCESCKNYIKTFVSKPEEPIALADVKTAFADEWAVSKGFNKHSINLIGIDFQN